MIFVSVCYFIVLTGLRFLRALRLMNVPDILQYLSILQSGSSIRLMQLLTIFLSVSLTGAGFIHLVIENIEIHQFWPKIYFLFVF